MRARRCAVNKTRSAKLLGFRPFSASVPAEDEERLLSSEAGTRAVANEDPELLNVEVVRLGETHTWAHPAHDRTNSRTRISGSTSWDT